jgi:DNA-binding Lrp family transcriptional regulator
MHMTITTIDKFDLQLLTELQRDGQATNSALGSKIHLSTSQVSRRVLRLQEGGVIDHYAAIIDPVAVGLDVMAFTEVTLDHHSPSASERFETEVAGLVEVTECYTLAGRSDYHLRVVAPDLSALSKFMTEKILRIPGVAQVKSTITLRKIKHTHVLPLDHVMQPTENRKRIQFT